MKKPTKNKANKPTTADPRPRGVYKKNELEAYALFIALPRKDRKEFFGFDTDQQFAKTYELNAGTLSDWKLREELWQERDKHLIHFKKHTGEIISKLAERAKRTGEAFHTLTFMKLVEGYTEKSGLDLTSKGKPIKGFEVTIRHAKTSPTTTRDKAAV